MGVMSSEFSGHEKLRTSIARTANVLEPSGGLQHCCIPHRNMIVHFTLVFSPNLNPHLDSSICLTAHQTVSRELTGAQSSKHNTNLAFN